MQSNKLFRPISCGTAMAAIVACPLLFAQPLDLSSQPIFLGTDAPPNILFLIDDSGSMDFEVNTLDASADGLFTGTQRDGRSPAGAGEPTHRDADEDGQPDCTFQDGVVSLGYAYVVEFASNNFTDGGDDCNTADDEAWRMRNHNFNSLYYNPDQVYTPWAGRRADGSEFTDINPENAPDDPYSPNEFINLLRHNSNYDATGNNGTSDNPRRTSDRDGDGEPDGFRYYNWVDDGDGVFENGEQVEVQVKDLPRTLVETDPGYPNSQTNFANWFAYYRSRDLVAKNAYGKVIADARNVRMGLITINNSAFERVRDMNENVASGNKRELMDTLYSFDPSGGTPLRSKMVDCGQYLACAESNNPIGTFFNNQCPRLSESQGGQCQQSFLVTMTDGFYNGGAPNIGNRDGDNNTPWDGGTYADASSNTLADIAMHYYERDLAPNLPNVIVPIPGVDEATHQHVVTYTVAFGVNGTLNVTPTDDGQAFAWPDPSAGNAEKIDDLRHAAFNGRGLFLDSSDPTTLDESLRNALSNIGDRTSSAAAIALNSGSLNVDSGVFQARFDSGDWSGELLFLPVSDGSGNTTGCTSEAQGELCPPRYDAGARLNQQNWDLQRTILTLSASSRAGIPFRWDQLAETQQDQMRNNPFGGEDFNDGVAEILTNYLRGERRFEGNSVIRNRSSVLGDIVNSDPVFVEAPVGNFDFDNYAAFRSANSNRTPVAYVGANDGMLHAFNADTGDELFAYVPNAVFKNLNRLVFSSYNNNHRYFVDGPPVAGDAFINSQWRTVLVSGLRSGGQAVFALDVTNPTAVSENQAASTVMWEFSDTDDANLGFTYSQPTITRMANGRWAAIISSGYNNTLADGNVSSTGKGYVFVLYLEGPGEDGSWDLGTDYERITLPAASGNTTTPAGIATPAVINIDDDIEPELIYVGDLNGNMWRIDVTNSNPAQWRTSFNNAPLFVAQDAAGVNQPITARPEVGAHPGGLANGLVVYFGTGKFLEESDNNPINAQTQTLYGIWDENTGSVTPSITRNDLLSQQILQEIAVSTNANDNNPDNDNLPVACSDAEDCFRITSDNDISYVSQSNSGGHRGWYMDLQVSSSNDNRGERQVSTPILREGRLLFTTLLPSGGVCDFGGDSFLMILDPENGGRLDFSPFDVDNNNEVNDNDFVQFDSDGDGQADEKIFVGGRKSRVGIIPRPAILAIPNDTKEVGYTSGSDGSTEDTLLGSGGRLGRIFWRQIQ